MNSKILENVFIENLVKNFRRSPLQRNKLQESDAELIEIPGLNSLLAITSDNLVEEIESGLYSDPFLIGWMTIMINLSDLAAVGAKPLGIVINETLKPVLDNTYLQKLQSGIEEACAICGTYVLGGDTNFSDRMAIGGCAIGLASKNNSLTRIGGKPGDILFATCKFGLGNAYALQEFSQNARDKNHSDNFKSSETKKIVYKPVAKLKEGILIRNYASCCMDTSDGFFTTLDQLIRLNNIGFRIDVNPEELIHLDAIKLSNIFNFSPLLMLAGIHGEFELLFTVPEAKVDDFLNSAKNNGQFPIKVGRTIPEAKIFIELDKHTAEIDTGRIRNLFYEFGNDIPKYIQELNFLLNRSSVK